MEDLVFHTGDSIIVIRTFGVQLLYNAIHGCTFPEGVTLCPSLLMNVLERILREESKTYHKRGGVDHCDEQKSCCDALHGGLLMHTDGWT